MKRLLVVVLLAGSLVLATSAQADKITATPVIGNGDTLTVSGCNFKPNSTYLVVFVGIPNTQVATDATGCFSLSKTVTLLFYDPPTFWYVYLDHNVNGKWEYSARTLVEVV
jgi:hypothetical protein